MWIIFTKLNKGTGHEKIEFMRIGYKTRYKDQHINHDYKNCFTDTIQLYTVTR